MQRAAAIMRDVSYVTRPIGQSNPTRPDQCMDPIRVQL